MKKLIGLFTISLLATTISFAQQGDGYNLDSWENAKTAPAKSAPAKAEPAKVEPAKTEPVKAEPAKAEPAKEAPAQPAPAKVTPAKPAKPAKAAPAKPAKAAPVKADSVKTTPATADTSKVDSVKTVFVPGDSSKVVAVPVDSLKADTAKAVSAKVDTTKAVPAKVDTVKTVVVKTDTVKVDSAKTIPVQADSVKKDSVKIDTVKTAPVQPDSAKADTVKADSAKVDSSKTDSVLVAADTTQKAKDTSAVVGKKPHGKITYAEYDSLSKARRDSAFLASGRYGFTFSGGRLYDKHVGEFADDFVWGTNLGVYYFYHYYFNSHFGIQGRLGALYRYSRFKDDYKYGSVEFKEESYELEREKSSLYYNVAVDAPISVRFGGHVYHKVFLYASLTLGVTKSLYERIDVSNKVSIVNPSAELEEYLTYVDDYPYKKSHKVDGAFNYDDWETNSWLGLGVDFKYIGFEFQALIAANSSKDNHRFQNMFHKAMPTWRFMVDFGAY